VFADYKDIPIRAFSPLDREDQVINWTRAASAAIGYSIAVAAYECGQRARNSWAAYPYHSPHPCEPNFLNVGVRFL